MPLCPQSQGAAWTLANPSCKLEQGDEVWPHLQLLLSPPCLPVVPEAFKAPSSVQHSPVLVQGSTQTSLGLQDWTGQGKYPEHLPNQVLLRDHCSQAALPLAHRLLVRQARHKGGWDGAQLLFKVILVFPTLESECADKSWQELRGQLLPVTLLKVPIPAGF